MSLPSLSGGPVAQTHIAERSGRFSMKPRNLNRATSVVPSRTSISAENRKMVEGRLRHYIDGKFKKIPELSCLMSSADSSWSGFLIEHQKYDAGRLSEPVCVYNPRLLVVSRGEITRSWRESGRQHMDRLKPGTIIFVDRCHQLDDVAFDASWEHLAIELEESKRDNWARSEDFPTTALLPHVTTEDARVTALAQCMYAEILSGCPSGKLYGESLSLALMSYAWERYASSHPPVRSRQSGLSTPKLRRLLDYMLANLTSELALQDLAEVVDLSPRHLCRSFKQATGTSPYRYILKERIERSKALLRMGNTSVAVVALSVGFSSQSHFADAFHKHTGSSL
jgi:AraC family transcriptional regulator